MLTYLGGIMKYLYEADNIIYAKCVECGRILKFQKHDLDEIATGVECFCGTISNTIDGMPKSATEKSTPGNTGTTANNTTVKPQPPQYSSNRSYDYTPRCPTCNSKNITKISLSSKAVGAVTLGILSSNVRKTFKCNSCGYKW